MHIPDGFIDGPTSATAGVLAVGVVVISLKRASNDLDEGLAPMAGLVAAFIFAVQMLNFPVASGTSGHLLGGALAAILMGPWVGCLCVTVVLLTQSLFADGGLSALGLNVINMAIVTAFIGYPLFRLLLRTLPRGDSLVPLAAGIAAGLTVPIAACVFTLEYAIGGTTSLSLPAVFAAMVGVHALIGIGEGVITGLTIGLVWRTRPDLVRGASALFRSRQLAAAGATA